MKYLQDLLRFHGEQLNLLFAMLVAYMAMNPTLLPQLVNQLVPEGPWRTVAGFAAGFLSFCIVRAAGKSDRKKAGDV